VGAHLPLLGLEPVRGEPLMSVTHGQCDARPIVTFAAARHQPPIAVTQYILYQIILRLQNCVLVMQKLETVWGRCTKNLYQTIPYCLVTEAYVC